MLPWRQTSVFHFCFVGWWGNVDSETGFQHGQPPCRVPRPRLGCVRPGSMYSCTSSQERIWRYSISYPWQTGVCFKCWGSEKVATVECLLRGEPRALKNHFSHPVKFVHVSPVCFGSFPFFYFLTLFPEADSREELAFPTALRLTRVHSGNLTKYLLNEWREANPPRMLIIDFFLSLDDVFFFRKGLEQEWKFSTFEGHLKITQIIDMMSQQQKKRVWRVEGYEEEVILTQFSFFPPYPLIKKVESYCTWEDTQFNRHLLSICCWLVKFLADSSFSKSAYGRTQTNFLAYPKSCSG